jgi:hypothetical protein
VIAWFFAQHRTVKTLNWCASKSGVSNEVNRDDYPALISFFQSQSASDGSSAHPQTYSGTVELNIEWLEGSIRAAKLA